MKIDDFASTAIFGTSTHSRASTRSLGRAIGPAPVGQRAAHERDTYAACLLPNDCPASLNLSFVQPHLIAIRIQPRALPCSRLTAPAGDVSEELSDSNRLRPVKIGRPPKRHAARARHAKPGTPYAELARLPNWASFRFMVPSRTYPQGGVPCRTAARTNLIRHASP